MIYVLLLEERNIYVGYSERPIGERFIEHFNYRGTKWTTLYRPLQVLHILPGGVEEENQMTLKMMAKYGWWKVRGGSWCQVNLESCPLELLEFQGLTLPEPLRQTERKPNRNIPSCCSRCGRDSHFVKDCFAKTHVNGLALDTCEQDACYRCGRSTHFAKDCYAKTHINGFYL
jgi:hypothetical protein